MRRPLLLVFIFLLFLSFVYTKDKSLDNIKDKENITIEGIVKDKIEKNKLLHLILIQKMLKEVKKK